MKFSEFKKQCTLQIKVLSPTEKRVSVIFNGEAIVVYYVCKDPIYALVEAYKVASKNFEGEPIFDYSEEDTRALIGSDYFEEE